MKRGFFPKLAWMGIRKNRRLYLPYMLSCIGTVLMTYIFQALGDSPLLAEMGGGRTLRAILDLGKFVIAFFSLIFLFYTNSFLIRRRYKEFGLYHVLGMNKRGLRRIAAWESLIVAGVSLSCGLLLGIAFSELAELGLLNAVRAEVRFRFAVDGRAILFTVEVFAAIFAVLFVKSLIQIGHTRPLELLRSENRGEKPPRGNRLLALVGLLLLAAAYWMAVTIRNPLDAMNVFFVAVLMVIAATYLLFMAGSVALCRLLQKNSGYYYRKSHFISVSMMAFRMKRHGAGLASICILSTMVLVMTSSSFSLFVGAEDSMRGRSPFDTQVLLNVRTLDRLSPAARTVAREEYERVFDAHGVTPTRTVEYAYASAFCTVDGAHILDDDGAFDKMHDVYFFTADDYNRLAGDTLTLAPDEAACCGDALPDVPQVFIGGRRFDVTARFDPPAMLGDALFTANPPIMLILPDFSVLEALGDDPALAPYLCFGCDFDADDETEIAVFTDQCDALPVITERLGLGDEYSYYADCLAAMRSDFYCAYGGLFFIGIMLSIVFIFAAAMMIYYKQVSEGYEDQARFAVMKKIGMTDRDIRKSIDAQVLTVFFAPLLCAGVHLAFSLPLVWRIFQMFYLHDLPLVIWANVGAFVLFALIYAVIYRITANAYYKIVSDPAPERVL